MKCPAHLIALLLAVGLASGCVERRFVITADPPGALVYCNGENLGLAGTPPTGGVDKFFTYYGKYRFTIVKDGYVTLTTEELIATPWYEYPPLDFFTENIWPFKVSDVRRLHFQLQPATKANAGDLLNKAEILRLQNNQIVSPLLPPKPGTAGSAPVVPGQPPTGVLPPQGPRAPRPLPRDRRRSSRRCRNFRRRCRRCLREAQRPYRLFLPRQGIQDCGDLGIPELAPVGGRLQTGQQHVENQGDALAVSFADDSDDDVVRNLVFHAVHAHLIARQCSRPEFRRSLHGTARCGPVPP